MVAGRGIVHSARTRDALRAEGTKLHGIQSWLALPQDRQEIDPSFRHHGERSLPEVENPVLRMRLIAGKAFGAVSPADTFPPMFYLVVEPSASAAIPLSDDYEPRAIFVDLSKTLLARLPC